MAWLWTLRSGLADAVPYGLCVAEFFSMGTPGPSLFVCALAFFICLSGRFSNGWCVFKCVGWESIHISTQDFIGIFLIGDEGAWDRKLSYNSAHDLRLLGITLYHLLAPWHRTPAGKVHQLFEQTQILQDGGIFSHQSTYMGFKCVKRRRWCQLHALNPYTGSWTFPLTDLQSCISLLASSANTAVSLEELG